MALEASEKGLLINLLVDNPPGESTISLHLPAFRHHYEPAATLGQQATKVVVWGIENDPGGLAALVEATLSGVGAPRAEPARPVIAKLRRIAEDRRSRACREAVGTEAHVVREILTRHGATPVWALEPLALFEVTQVLVALHPNPVEIGRRAAALGFRPVLPGPPDTMWTEILRVASSRPDLQVRRLAGEDG